MARPATLTEDEKKAKRKEINENAIKFHPPTSLRKKFDAFCNGKNKTEVLINMMNNYPAFKNFSYTE